LTRPRLLVASAIALAALVGTGLPAGAGQAAFTIDDTVSCNTVTGEYDITFPLTNNLAEEGDIFVDVFQVDGVDQPLTFTPNPVAANGTSTATYAAPGDTTGYVLEVTVTYGDFDADFSINVGLNGDCEADPTTTTTATPSTTAAPTTSTTAPAARAIALTPAFTG
jgi:hypothetical protein